MQPFKPPSPHLVLPVGTQIVTRKELIHSSTDKILCLQGAVGEIIESPTDNSHSYRILLLDGTEINLNRHDFSIRKHFQAEGLSTSDDKLTELDLQQYIIYRCIVGSRAYGLDEAGSDTDRRGIYLPTAELHWSLYGIAEQIENHQTQECYWELQKFLILALKANPNVLECLHSPLQEIVTPIARELLELRSIFLSKLVYQTYNGYVLSQFKKMEQDLRTKGEVRPKHAMHLIRLLLSGIEILKEGTVPVRVDIHREELLAIKHQEMPWTQINEWRLNLHQKFDTVFSNSKLPERPDYIKANNFLIQARQSMVKA